MGELTVKILTRVRDVSESDVQTDGEDADGEVKPGNWSEERQQDFG